MTLGGRPRLTVVTGGLLMIAAMVGATLLGAYGGGLPAWFRTLLLVLCIPTAIAGWIMTFRDLSNPLPRDRHDRGT